MQIHRENGPLSPSDLIVLKLRGRICPNESPDTVDIGSLFAADVFGRTVALDLREAEYMDSSGVNWLLSQRKALADAGGKLALCCAEGAVLDVLRIMRIDRLLPVASTLEGIPRPDATV